MFIFHISLIEKLEYFNQILSNSRTVFLCLITFYTGYCIIIENAFADPTLPVIPADNIDTTQDRTPSQSVHFPIIIKKHLIPAGSYLQSCSYSFIGYTPKGLSVNCRGHKDIIYYDKLQSCYDSNYDIRWDHNLNKLACDSSEIRVSHLIGSDSPPLGHYTDSCSSILYDHAHGMLYASCKKNNDDNGSYRISLINVITCDNQDIININGHLVCADFPYHHSNSIPFGSYLHHCLASSTHVQDYLLKTQCEATSVCTRQKMEAHCGGFDLESCLKSHNFYHLAFSQFSTEISSCDSQGLNICKKNETLYCTRSLPDDAIFNLKPARVPPGTYLKKCMNLFYDKQHDILNARCAIGKAEHIYSPTKECVDTSKPEVRTSAISLMTNASKCDQIAVNSQGHLYCGSSIHSSHAFDPFCGKPLPSSPLKYYGYFSILFGFTTFLCIALSWKNNTVSSCSQ